MNTLNDLPENMSIDQLIDHLIFVEKIQKGINDSKNGIINTKNEAKQKLNKWIK
jgi:hypothetical protein